MPRPVDAFEMPKSILFRFTGSTFLVEAIDLQQRYAGFPFLVHHREALTNIRNAAVADHQTLADRKQEVDLPAALSRGMNVPLDFLRLVRCPISPSGPR